MQGPAALAWPHRVVTLDTVLYELLTHILRADLLHWPGGHRELHVLDTWHAQLPVTYSRTKPVLTLTDAHIVASHHREPRRVPTVGQEEFDEAVRQGICTHDDVRTVIQLALATEEVRDSVLTFVRTTMRSLIVDEVFDANTLDLDLIDIAARAGIAITLVGDPWQALYAFREPVRNSFRNSSGDTHSHSATSPPPSAGEARDKRLWPANYAPGKALSSIPAWPPRSTSSSPGTGRPSGTPTLTSCPWPSNRRPDSSRKLPAPCS